MLTVDGEVHSQSSLLLLAVGRGPVSTGNLNVSLIYIVCTVATFLFITCLQKLHNYNVLTFKK